MTKRTWLATFFSHSLQFLRVLSRKLAFVLAIAVFLSVVITLLLRSPRIGMALGLTDAPSSPVEMRDTSNSARFQLDQNESSEMLKYSNAAMNSSPSDSQQAEWVTTMLVRTSRNMASARSYTGVITPSKSSDLAFLLTGQVEQLLVDQGELVAAGETMAVLDTTALRADKAVRLAELNAAKAQLAELEAGPREESIAAARAKLDEYKAMLELAKITSERNALLFEARAGSKQNFDDARLQAEAMQNKVDSQQEVLRELVAGTRMEQIASQKAMVQKIAASVERIDVEIEESHLYAPYDAIVSERSVDEGMIVSPGTVLFRVVQLTEPEAWIGLPANVAASLTVGDHYELEASSSEPLQATLKSVLPELDPTTRTQTCVFAMHADENTPRFGQVVRISRLLPEKEAGIWLPTSALTQSIRGLWSVFVVGNPSVSEQNSGQVVGELERRIVEVLQTENDSVLVRGTLQEGEHVVASGVEKLVEGQVVRSEISGS